MTVALFKTILLKKRLQIRCDDSHLGMDVYFEHCPLDHSGSDRCKGCMFIVLKRKKEMGVWDCLVVSVQAEE